MNDCIFCKIINGDIPNHKIYENESTLVFLDISKDAEGHTLVIPKKHYQNIFDVPESELTNILSTVKKVSTHYHNLGYTGVNILNNSGTSAGQSVQHIHFHIIPRKENDNSNIFAALSIKDLDLNALEKKLKIKN